MKQNIIILLGGAILLLIVPSLFLVTHWVWQPTAGSYYLKVLLFLTQTAGNPWSAVTSVILALWFCWCLRLPLEKSIKLLIILIIMVVSVVLLKSVLKEISQEARPFVVWLSDIFHFSTASFYQLSKSGRVAWLAQHTPQIPIVPTWLIHYWQTEVSYSFPSGHTLFSACWALLGLLLLYRRRCYITCLILFIWQIGISVSRLVLGMHWPQDIIFSILFALPIVFLIQWGINRVLPKLAVYNT